jgi:transposase-like protein
MKLATKCGTCGVTFEAEAGYAESVRILYEKWRDDHGCYVKPTEPAPSRCPMCGSDDPENDGSSIQVASYICPDPYHSPSKGSE